MYLIHEKGFGGGCGNYAEVILSAYTWKWRWNISTGNDLK